MYTFFQKIVHLNQRLTKHLAADLFKVNTISANITLRK